MEHYINFEPAIPKKYLLKQLKESLGYDGFEQLSSNKWEKAVGKFVEVVSVQSDRWIKGNYDIRLGIIITNTSIGFLAEGHFTKMIPNFNTSYEEILQKIRCFFVEWTNKKSIVKNITEMEKALNELSKFCGEELDLKKKEFYALYDVAVTNRNIVNFILSPEFLNAN